MIGPRPERGTAPASEQHTTMPSALRCQRIGRNPLRSSEAPTRRPSVKMSPAGPSHGSVTEAWKRKKSRTSGSRSRTPSHASGTSIATTWRTSRPRAQQQLERGVELAGVGVVGIEHGTEQLLGTEAGGFGAEDRAGVHPPLVALDGVDLAVVAELPERLGALPRRRGVRREPAVEDHERRDEVRVREVGVEGHESVADHERLVGDGREGPAGEVVPDAGSRAGRLRPPARAQGTTLRVVLVDVCRSRQHCVQQRGQVVERGRAELRLVDRHLPPPDDLEALLDARVDDRVLGTLACGAIASIEVGGGDADALRVHGGGAARDRGEELAWQREEHAGTVAGEPVGGDRTPVPDAREARERELDDLSARAAVLVGDEPDPAGVELEPLAGSPTRTRQSRTRNKRQLGLPGSWARHGATTLSRTARIPGSAPSPCNRSGRWIGCWRIDLRSRCSAAVSSAACSAWPAIPLGVDSRVPRPVPRCARGSRGTARGRALDDVDAVRRFARGATS